MRFKQCFSIQQFSMEVKEIVLFNKEMQASIPSIQIKNARPTCYVDKSLFIIVTISK